MLTESEREIIFKHAYIPEHLPDYVQGITLAEPHMHEKYLCFSRGTTLVFIGYPLPASPDGTSDLSASLNSAYDRFQPTTVDLIAPTVPANVPVTAQETDYYLRLGVPLSHISRDEAYMVRRARREIIVKEGAFSEEHDVLIQQFIAERRLSTAHRTIFGSLAGYLDRSRTARLLEARKGNDLVAFTILDLGASEYGFYLFNFRSSEVRVPGASDLLLWEMARLASEQGKRYLNLGLGVNAGIRGFKMKWGAVPFLPYNWVTIQRQGRGLSAIVRAILKGGRLGR